MTTFDTLEEKPFEHIVGKEENAGNQHFLLFPKRHNGKSFSNLTLYHIMTTFDTLEEKPFEHIVGKEENAGNQHFLLFPQRFLSYERQF